MADISGSVSQPYQYLSFYSEGEIGLYLKGKRWYDPDIGRYISRKNSYSINSPYIFSNNNPVSSLPVYTSPISDITTSDNPKEPIMFPETGGFGSFEIGYGVGSWGRGNIFWCDSSCYLHFIEFYKICWGPYVGISVGGGVTSLPPEGTAIEISVPIPLWPPSLGPGFDVGFGDEGTSVGFSYGWDIGIRSCTYYIERDSIIGKCN